MYLIPEARVPDHIGSRIANTGASFAVAVAYLLSALGPVYIHSHETDSQSRAVLIQG